MKPSTQVPRLIIVILLLSLLVLPVGCSEEQTSDKLKVVTTTSIIASIVEQVGADMVEVANIIPPGQCPGHFDAKPSDVRVLVDAQLFFMHGWQGETFNTQLIDSANNPDLKIVSLNIDGNWMTPTVHSRAVGNITAALVEADPENAEFYQSNAASFQNAIAAKGNELKAELTAANVSQYKVICGDMIKGLIVWTGFNVIASYPRPEDLTPQKMQELIDKGKENSVAIVIDNLQSGKGDAGVTMADEIGAVQVTLTNFPGGFDNTETWEKALKKDVELLLAALAEYQQSNP